MLSIHLSCCALALDARLSSCSVMRATLIFSRLMLIIVLLSRRRYVNADGRVFVKYSTIGEYTRAKQNQGLQFELKQDDFFPLGSPGSFAYWTGTRDWLTDR